MDKYAHVMTSEPNQRINNKIIVIFLIRNLSITMNTFIYIFKDSKLFSMPEFDLN